MTSPTPGLSGDGQGIHQWRNEGWWELGKGEGRGALCKIKGIGYTEGKEGNGG